MREPREVAETLNDFFSIIVGTDKTTEGFHTFSTPLRQRRTANIIEDYFSDRQQRVKVAGEYSSWNYISRGIAQGSIL